MNKNEAYRISFTGDIDHSDMGRDVCQHESAAATWFAADGDIPAAFHRGLAQHLDNLASEGALAVVG